MFQENVKTNKYYINVSYYLWILPSPFACSCIY